MRFRKGTKVEVMRKSEAPAGHWWLAEIVSGNGHTYCVKYSQFPDDAVERVSRKFLRPRPPPLGGTENCVPGDIVEVLDCKCWKLAEVSKVVSKHYFFVRFIGSSREFCVHKSNLRVRQAWQDNKWVVIGKDSQNCELATFYKSPVARTCMRASTHLLSRDLKMRYHVGDTYLQREDDAAFPEKEIHVPSCRSPKRGLFRCLPHAEINGGPDSKVRAVEVDGRVLRLVSKCQSPLLEKG